MNIFQKLLIFRRTFQRTSTAVVVGLLLLLGGPVWMVLFGPVDLSADWRTASHNTTSQAPNSISHPGAVVQVYASRAFNWRGAFAVHTWIAAKPPGVPRYTRYEVIGWNLRNRSTSISVSDDMPPDAQWYGVRPRVELTLHGAEAEEVIARLSAAVSAYPQAERYAAWPGPNSNTFVAYLAREIPQLHLAMPANAIGKDYLPNDRIIAKAPSGTGYQISLFGLFGILVAAVEGIELNVFGLVIGLDVARPALKLPGIGRLPDW